MTDRAIGSGTDDRTIAAEGDTEDRAQHASADVAPELFGW